MLILLLLLVSPNGVESYPAGQCNKKDRSGGNQWFCCNNHEEVNGNCIRCVNGFESFDGSPCMPCPKGLWGGECAKKCSCTKDQICDHILGCINIQIDMPEETTVISGKTDGLQLTSTMTEFIRFTTFLSHSIKLFTIRGKDTTVWINAPKTTSTTSKPNKNDLVAALFVGLSTTAMLAYSICATIFVLFVILCSVCQRRYKKIYDIFKMYQTGNSRRNTTDHTLTETPLRRIEGIYEEIDELNMIDNVRNLRDGDTSVAHTNGSYVKPDNDGYLTPFQPDDEYTSTDNSNENKSESLASSHDHHSFPIDHLSTSSSADVQERRSSYLNPYQPIVHSADIHEYSSINSINESSSSGSEKLWRGSGYLNPYQPMVPDLDLHDYKSVPWGSDGSMSQMLDACTTEIVQACPQICHDKKSEIDKQKYKSSNDISSETVSEGITSQGSQHSGFYIHINGIQ